MNDAEPLAHDPTFRLIGSEQIWERGAALTSRVHSFETELLTQDENLTGLAAINRELLAKVEGMESSHVRYAIRIPSNDILEREVADLLTRPVGRPSYTSVARYTSFRYQAARWTTARRIVAKIEFHCGELFPRVGFIVTTLEADSRAVVRFYNKGGTAEQ